MSDPAMGLPPADDPASSDPVLFRELPTRDGHVIGVAMLNRPQTLNGLSLPMCELLAPRLRAWAANDRIVAVVLHGAGEKAFCAGGDLHALYRSMQESPAGDAWANVPAREFFAAEYRLDFQIHRYSKPVLCWGSGIVMGGGVGLMLGASHRIVTATTRFAMPEITIGLYPDVAGTWMLSRLPPGVGAFLAFTGTQLGAADCLHYGLADWICDPHGLDAVLSALADAHWGSDREDAFTQVDAVLQACQSAEPDPGPLQQHAAIVRRACASRSFGQIAAHIARWRDHADPWLARAAETFLAGSPGSARLSHTLLAQAHHRSLADALRAEYIASLHCCAQPDFREGIRALLIDKDRTPRWDPATPAQATSDWVQRFLVPPWPAGQAHPLADLDAGPAG